MSPLVIPYSVELLSLVGCVLSIVGCVLYIIRYGVGIKISVAILDCVCFNVPMLAIRRDTDG